jgi:hypothetical protein
MHSSFLIDVQGSYQSGYTALQVRIRDAEGSIHSDMICARQTSICQGMGAEASDLRLLVATGS